MIQVLYEIAFAYGVMESKFHLFSSIPRTLIPQEMSLLDAAAVSSVLSVEHIDEGIDSQEFIQAVNVASGKCS